MTSDAWEEALFGPVPPPQAAGMGAFARFKRVTTGHNVASNMRRQREELIADLPRIPRRDEHVPLVIHRAASLYYAACGAWSCDFLGPARDVRDTAAQDAQRHAVEHGLGGWDVPAAPSRR